jgi:hypothetical protein
MLSSVDALRVLLVAGDPLARAGLATLLDDQPGFIVVGQGAGCGTCRPRLPSTAPTWWYGT